MDISDKRKSEKARDCMTWSLEPNVAPSAYVDPK